MRLIDADVLIMALRLEYPMMPMFKENQEEWGIKTEGYRKAEEVIRNAPTIEPTEEFEWCHGCKEYDQEKHCCHRWSKQISETVAELEETYKPKRGEWIWDEQILGLVCSECKELGVERSNFCPNCGADMRGKGND